MVLSRGRDVVLVVLAAVACGCGDGGGAGSSTGSFSQGLVFNEAPAGSSADHGQVVFGIAADGIHAGNDPDSLFVGFSAEANQNIASNGRTCFTCHRPDSNFMINPLLPLDANLSADDPLIKPENIVADSGGNPDAPDSLTTSGWC